MNFSRKLLKKKMLQRCKSNSTDVRLDEFRQRNAHFEIRPKEERAERSTTPQLC